MVNSEDGESNDNNKEEDNDRHTASECAYMNITLEDNNCVESVEEEEEKRMKDIILERKKL